MNRTSKPLLRSDELRRWTNVSPSLNIICVLFEYACLIAIHSVNIYFIANSFSGFVVVPFAALTILATGCIMHRIGLLGHEASHGLLYPNRKWNDFLSDLLCFYPLWSSTDSYRIKHLGHHLHPNDPDQDPNMAGDKTEELYARFPMPRPEFIWNYYAKFFWPPFVLTNLLDLFRMLAMGKVPCRARKKEEESGSVSKKLLKSPTFLGLGYILIYIMVSRHFVVRGDRFDILAAQLLVIFSALVVWSYLPEKLFKAENRKSHATPKGRALMRLIYYTGIISIMGWAKLTTGFQLGGYYLLFWIFPLVYIFPYLMLLREIYQHANLGQGQLDNSRIIHADPFTQWALLAYGNDYHLVHHIYPNIPHYHLKEAHETLLRKSDSYRETVKETSGTFRPAQEGMVPLLDSLSQGN